MFTRSTRKLFVEELESRLTPASFYWVGGAGANGSDWFTGTNWQDQNGVQYQGNQIPTSIDSVYFDAKATKDCIIGRHTAEMGSLNLNVGFIKKLDVQSGSIDDYGASTSNLATSSQLVTDVVSAIDFKGGTVNLVGGILGTTGQLYLSGGVTFNCLGTADVGLRFDNIWVGKTSLNQASTGTLNVATSSQDMGGNLALYSCKIEVEVDSYFNMNQNQNHAAGNVVKGDAKGGSLTNYGYFTRPTAIDNSFPTGFDGDVVNQGYFTVAPQANLTVNSYYQTGADSFTFLMGGSTFNVTSLSPTQPQNGPGTVAVYIAAGEFATSFGQDDPQIDPTVTVNLLANNGSMYVEGLAATTYLVVGGTDNAPYADGYLNVNGTLMLQNNVRLIIYADFTQTSQSSYPVSATKFEALSINTDPTIEVRDLNATQIPIGSFYNLIYSQQAPFVQNAIDIAFFGNLGNNYGLFQDEWITNPNNQSQILEVERLV